MPPHNRRRRKRPDEAYLAGMSEAERAAEMLRRKGELSLAEAGLVVRTVNTLESRHLSTLNDVMEQEADELLAIANFGTKTLQELYAVVIAQGLKPPNSWLLALPRNQEQS